MPVAVFVGAVLLLALIGISFGVVLYQVIKQQGRLLLRLDAIEGHLGLDAQMTLQTGLARAGVLGQGDGLPQGTVFPPFRVPDLTGRLVSLEDFRGQRVLLIHWSPSCGFCTRIAPSLAQLAPDLRSANVQLLLVSSGAADSNRRLAEEHRLPGPILLQNRTQIVDAFRTQGTPVAYLLDEQARVARPIAVGAEQVTSLAWDVAADGRSARRRLPGERPLNASRIERNGLPAGTPAPAFRLPDLDGHPVSLEEYRGRRVLLVFTDPHCGPCDQLAPDLVRLFQEHRQDGLAVIVVGRGDATENRRKAAAYGFEFPVVRQERWEISRRYGIFATPVAFLIDEKGVIARNVARGVEEILALAANARMLAKADSEGR